MQVALVVWPWGAYLGAEGLKQGIRAKVSSYSRHHWRGRLRELHASGLPRMSALTASSTTLFAIPPSQARTRRRMCSGSGMEPSSKVSARLYASCIVSRTTSCRARSSPWSRLGAWLFLTVVSSQGGAILHADRGSNFKAD